MHRNVLLALLGLAALLVLCPYCRAPAIEDDIRTRTATELRGAGLEIDESLSVSGRDVTLSGFAASDDERRRLGDAAASVWGVRTVHNLLEVAPAAAAVFVPGTLTLIKRGPSLTMRGVLPGDDLMAALVAEANREWGEANVTNELSVDRTLDGGGWPGWIDRLVSALHLRRGDLTITLAGSTATVEGTVLSELTKERILGAVEAILPGFDVIDRVTVREPENQYEVLQVGLDAQLAGKVVEFESDSAELTPAGTAILDQVAALMKGNPGRLQISGHTDSQASPEYNLDLSRRRAEAVRGYLEASGIDADRLVAIGFGEARPIASNETEAGRQRNRRTEFHVVEEN